MNDMYCRYQCKMNKNDESGDKKQIVNMNEVGGTTLLPNVKLTCIDGNWNASIQDYKCIGNLLAKIGELSIEILHITGAHCYAIEYSVITMIIFQSVSPYLAIIIKVVSFVKPKILRLTMPANTHALDQKSQKRQPRPLARQSRIPVVQLSTTNGNRRFKMAPTINLHV